MPGDTTFRVAEFFAGIGLVRLALEREEFAVVWANDLMPQKAALYAANFGADDFALCDVRTVHGQNLPTVDLATASFPCTDLSLAGNRGGIRTGESSMFFEFARVVSEMPQRPRALLLENVSGFATSHGGDDLRMAIKELNDLGYSCDIFAVNAARFVPQSRPRMFIVASLHRPLGASDWGPSDSRPPWVQRFVQAHPDLLMHAHPLPALPATNATLADVVQRLPWNDGRWWDDKHVARFCRSLSQVNRARLQDMKASGSMQWATAYRRTRGGEPVWEIRADNISGCLRTARGGSSRQAIVEAGRDKVRVRWVTAVECARLQGAGDFAIEGVSENQALFGFGDAVCVPVIQWIARHYLSPLLNGGIELGPLSGKLRASA